MLFGYLCRNIGLPGILISSRSTERLLQRAIQSRSPTKAMLSCKHWEHFLQSRRARYIYVGEKKWGMHFTFHFQGGSRAWGALACSLVEAQPHCWFCRGDTSSPTEAQVHSQLTAVKTWIYVRGERLATSTRHLLVHLCGHVDPLPASTWPGQAWSKHRVTPRPRNTNYQQTPVGLDLLHVTVAHPFLFAVTARLR